MAFQKKKPAATVAQDTQVLEVAKTVTLDSTLAKLASAQVDVQKRFGEIQSIFTGKLDELGTVERAIELKHKELADLQGISVVATTLGELQAAVQEAVNKKAETEASVAKEREREQEEYDYQLGIERRQKEADFAVKDARREQGIAEREAKLKAAEEELAALKALRDGQQKLVADAVKTAEAILTHKLNKEHEHKDALAGKDNGYKLAELQSQVASANATNSGLVGEQNRLRQELTVAHKTIQELGAKALEAGSGRSALEAVQRQMELAQPTANSKNGR